VNIYSKFSVKHFDKKTILQVDQSMNWLLANRWVSFKATVL